MANERNDSHIYTKCPHCVIEHEFECDTYTCDLRPDDLYLTSCIGCKENMQLVEPGYLDELKKSMEVVLKMRAMSMKA